MKLSRNIPVLSFLGRYWLLLLLFVAFLLLTLNERLFQAVGAVLYAPVLATVAMLAAAFLRHIFWRKTLDEDVRTERFHEWWDQYLAPAEKARWILVVTLGLFLGICQIIAALAK